MKKPSWVGGGPRIKSLIPGPRAKRLLRRDRRVMSPSYTRAEPVVAEEGWGCYIKDVDGNVILDLTSGMFVMNYGYSHPRLIAAVEKQLRKLTHFAGTDFYYEAQVDLAERLVSMTPGRFNKKVFLSNSGTEAVEAAFKCVRWHTGRPRMIAFEGGFHGRTMGSLSLTSNVKYSERFAPLVPGVSFMPFPNPYRPPMGWKPSEVSHMCIEYIIRATRDRVPANEVAAVITEPIQGTSGYVIPPPDFYPMLKELCEENGWIFIADEIQTGLGRSGKMFAIEHWGVVPDIICLAKGLGGGIAPIGATIARESIMDWKPGAHASTFGGNLVACAAAIEGLKILKEERLVDRVARLGKKALKRLKEIGEKSKIVGDVRGMGFLMAIEFVKSRNTKDYGVDEREMVMQEALKRGLLLFRGGKSSIRIAPNFTIPERDLELGLDILEESIREVERRC
ncbi:MAG: acetyl ornithine aminotransferase family protein [Candidatus Hadarchaeales archaeon]